MLLGKSSVAPQYWNGTIDDVQVYDRAISDAEIAQIAGGTTTSGDTTPPSVSLTTASTTARGTLLSASHDQTVRLWDAASAGELGACVGHTGRVLAVGSDHGLIASGGVDMGVRLWQVPATA